MTKKIEIILMIYNYIEKCVNFYDINQTIYKNLIDSRSSYDIPK